MSAVLLEIEPPGVFHGVPIETYHASAALSNSGLGDFARSPAHYFASHLDPRRPPEEETPAKLVGNLAHCAILEPDQFDSRYKVGPCNDKRLAEWKEWERDLKKHVGAGVQCIKPEQRALAFAQADSVRKIADVEALLASGHPEVSAFWIDSATGELCRARPDWVHPVGSEQVILCDVKTTGCAAANEFSRQAHRLRYANQAALYADGYAIASGQKVVGMVFIVVECDWPYAAAAYMLPDEWIDLARRENAALIERFAECRSSGNWPGYGDTVQLLEMPPWVGREALP